MLHIWDTIPFPSYIIIIHRWQDGVVAIALGQYDHPHFSKVMCSIPAWGAVTSVTPNFDGILGIAL